jgi:DNA-binding MarR family transcriptional regulator
VDEAEAEVRKVLDALRQIVRELRVASRDAEKRVGLSAAQLFVLQKVAEAKALSVNDVAHRTHTHQSSVSVVVRRLAQRGLVSRKRSRDDARQVQISATAAGLALLRSAPAATQDRLIAALRDTPKPAVRQLARALQSFLDRLGIDSADPAGMLFEDEESHARKRR